MQDDFDDEMDLPDDELAGDSLSDGGDLELGDLDAEPEIDDEVPSRPSGGARAMKLAGAPARRSTPEAETPPAKKVAAKKPAPKKKAAPKKKIAKAATKSKKAAPKKASKKAGKKKSAKKAGKKR
jgi:hypothetical protein